MGMILCLGFFENLQMHVGATQVRSHHASPLPVNAPPPQVSEKLQEMEDRSAEHWW